VNELQRLEGNDSEHDAETSYAVAEPERTYTQWNPTWTIPVCKIAPGHRR